jgi:hypothetical protein
MATPKHAGKHKTVCKKRVLNEKQPKKQYKVIILSDSHARGCATEVNHLLKNEFEVLWFLNPGSGMKHIKDTSKVKLQLLTTNEVVLWGGGPKTAKNNSTVGMKYLLDLVINATHAVL